MPRLFIYLIFFTFLNKPVCAQVQSAEENGDPTHWITYSQTYFKLPVAQAGMYRITASELQLAGVPVSRIDPTTIQLFHRGIEQAIYVDGEADRHFDSTDFIEFYGRANDGSQDSLLYRPHKAQPHAYYSLFNDTTAYFLTWRLDNKTGRRMTPYTDTSYAGLSPETYHWAEEVRLFTDNYPGWAAGIPPKIEYSFYEAGEGYTGLVQQKDKPYANLFSLPNAVRTGPIPQIDVLLVGRDFTNHRVDCLAGPTITTQHQLDSASFSGYTNGRIQQNINWRDISPTGQLFLSTISRSDHSTMDNYSVSYIRLRYPQRLTTNGQSTCRFTLAPNPKGRSWIDVSAVSPFTRFWDISDPTTPVRVGVARPSTNAARFVAHGTDTERIILCVSEPKSVPAIQPVTFINWTSRKPAYLIISHESLMQPVGASPIDAVREYARYRASTAGGKYDTLVVTMQQLIDQYSYGERNPLAIRRFAAQLLRQSQGALQYLLLIGRSRSTPGIRHDPNQASLDMVMTAGFPGSDLVFTTGLNEGEPDMPAIATGRINAGSAQEVINYLNKVKEYERLPVDVLWRKNLLHLSGGEEPTEITLFRQLVNTYRNQAVNTALGAQVTTISKDTDKLVESINVAKSVNEGIGLMTFFGHSGLDVTDLDIGFASNDALGYRNQGKYPLLLINGCAVGNFFYGRPTLATDWVLTPDRGGIAAIAHSHLGYPDVMHQYTTTLYNLLTDSTHLNKSVGQLQQETIRRVLAHTTDERALANCQQMVLQGDPAIRLFPFTTPDYVLTTGGLTVQGTDHQPLRAESDSVQIRAVVQNAGQYWTRTVPVRIRRLVNGRESSIFNWLLPQSIAYRDTLTLTFPNEQDAEGQNQFEVTINPADSPSAVSETNHTNNLAVANITLTSQKPILIYPVAGSVVKTTAVRLTAYYVASSAHLFDLEIDSSSRFNSPVHQSQRIMAMNTITYTATLPNRPNTTYYWRVRLADTSLDSTTGWVTGFFMYAPNSSVTGLPEGQILLSSSLPTDIRQGDTVSIPVEFTNLSPYAFTDSLVVQQTIYATGLSNPQTKQWRIQAPFSGDTLRFITQITTENLPGLNRILLTINPRRQPEYSFQNNTLDLTMTVQPDAFGPILDVAFDGARIVNDAIVSATPMIDVLVADDNRSLIRRDTTGLTLFLRRPGHTSVERLNWRTATIQSTAADNVFRVRYPSPELIEGKYNLLITARDAVGNAAVPYQVRFNVIKDRKLTALRVYPNPFRDQTRLSFTLTGDQAPANVAITITNLNGNVVRTLKLAAHIGLNEWLWDGRSDANVLLPAGVYIYKLIITDTNEWPAATGLNSRLSGRIILIR